MLNDYIIIIWSPRTVFLVAQMVKNTPAVWGTWVRSLGWEDPLEEGMATHFSIFAWRLSMDRVHGVTESDTAEQLSIALSPCLFYSIVWLHVMCSLR